MEGNDNKLQIRIEMFRCLNFGVRESSTEIEFDGAGIIVYCMHSVCVENEVGWTISDFPFRTSSSLLMTLWIHNQESIEKCSKHFHIWKKTCLMKKKEMYHI